MDTQRGTAPAAAAAGHFRSHLVYELAAEELAGILSAAPDEVCLIDVRDAGAYAAGHIPTALSVPLESLEAEAASLPRDRTIVVYCGDGECGQSLRAALELARSGFRVRRLVGGLAEWGRTERPLTRLSQAW
jgi:rhodanese-related sulfurtransferase